MRDERRPASPETPLRRHLTVLTGGAEGGAPGQDRDTGQDDLGRPLDEQDVAALRAFISGAGGWVDYLHPESSVREFAERSVALARRRLLTDGHQVLRAAACSTLDEVQR